MLTRDEKVVHKYLQNYAEPESNSLPELPRFDHCLVIPVFDEAFESLERVWQRIRDNYLVILVANAPRKQHVATLRLMQEATSRATNITTSGRCTYLSGTPDILLVDRCSVGNTIAPHQGVGLARKIGADIALRLIFEGVIKSLRISNTDADSVLPGDYFATSLADNDAALVFPFSHDYETGLQVPTLLYEISILYYACGLDWAGSAYGYTCLGSTMAVSAAHYAKVRGFPRRNAAEDFYLLNKLAKTGAIRRILSTPIVLSGRLSKRVPVGTGAGISKIADLDSPLDEYHFYHPRIFALLNEFLKTLATIWDTPGTFASATPAVQHYCQATQLPEFIAKQRAHYKQEIVFNKFLTDWFDGFRTLKFVHFMRDHYLPSAPLNKLGEAEFVNTDLLKDLSVLKQQLSGRLFQQAPGSVELK
ncbi:MAG: hypothetical protein O6945_15230 [Gammaproteobacteria bacterium]|nr:hypothetical protein [Gammaproteobacteria bacterium]